MNLRLMLRLVGRALIVEGALMLPSALVGAIYQSGDVAALLYAALTAAGVGALLCLIPKPANGNLRAREGFITVALVWIAFSFFGALPFMFHGVISSLTDAFFEAVSGFTTTGSSTMRNVEVIPHGLMFWRSFTVWVGGMGVLILSLALMPNLGTRSVHLLKAESTGPSPGKLVPRIGNTAKILYGIYGGLSALCLISMLLCGMDLYDALIHMFGTAGTGGFSNYYLSIGHFKNTAIDAVTLAFMLLFGVNYSLYFFLIQRNMRAIWKNEELRVYLGVVLISTVAIALNIVPKIGDVWSSLGVSFFHVASVVTTTGYVVTDFGAWPQFSRTLLVLLMLVGACAGSATGGIKLIRAMLLIKAARRDVHQLIQPRGVRVIKLDGRVVSDTTVGQVTLFFFMYLVVIVATTMLISLDGYTFETNLTAAISAVSNIGVGLGVVGPGGSFDGFSPLSKWGLSLCMLVGRLEIYPILMLCSPSIWRKN